MAPPEDLKDALDDIMTNPTVRLWPTVGKLLNISRNSVYAAAARNEIDVIRIGRSMRAVSSSLRKRLGIEPLA